MTVRRIVANISAPDLDRVLVLDEELLLDLKVVMDYGWILTFCIRGISGAATQRCERGRFGDTSSRSVN